MSVRTIKVNLWKVHIKKPPKIMGLLVQDSFEKSSRYHVKV